MDAEATEPQLLFAYGTLVPYRTDLEDQGEWDQDAVRGLLFDLGSYPVLVNWDDPEAGWVEGHVRPTSRSELVEVLDPYEGVEEGLFLRVAAVTRSGRSVWLYGYPHPVPMDARGPITRWEGPSRAVP